MVETTVERRLLSYFRKISFFYDDAVIPIENFIFLSVSDSMRTMLNKEKILFGIGVFHLEYSE
jgi:hypothetical protein